MVLGAISTAIRIGQLVYRIYRFQDRAIGRAYRGFPRQVRVGVQSGAGLGLVSGGAVEYFKQEEQGGNIIGLPEKIKQGKYNRQPKARNQVFQSARGGRRSKRGKYRYCPPASKYR